MFSGAQRTVSIRRTKLAPDAAEAQTMGSANRIFIRYLQSDVYLELRKSVGVQNTTVALEDSAVSDDSDSVLDPPPRKKQRREG